MISAKRIITILGTLFCALAIGFFMQHYMQGPAPADRSAQVQVASVNNVQDVAPMTEEVQPNLVETPAQDVIEPVALSGMVPVPPSAAPQPDLLPDEPVTLAALDDQPIEGELPAEEPAPTFGCEIDLRAQPVAAAMVKLTLTAPCQANAQFTLHHNGMMFSDATDENGEAVMTVPALNSAAIFIATFTEGASAVASVEVSTLEYYDRVVAQWSGLAGLQIHALEYGAAYGEDGHVWAGAARDMASAARGEGGFMVRLGDPEVFNPLLAEVYTFPSGTALKGGEIDLSLEAEVTEANCGKDIEAQTLQKPGSGKMVARDLLLAMPDCEAIGDFLVLKNMFDDLNIAGN